MQHAYQRRCVWGGIPCPNRSGAVSRPAYQLVPVRRPRDGRDLCLMTPQRHRTRQSHRRRRRQPSLRRPQLARRRRGIERLVGHPQIPAVQVRRHCGADARPQPGEGDGTARGGGDETIHPAVP
eukprot:scaffold4191_cov95-Isochrysis_galbana.AAC.3